VAALVTDLFVDVRRRWLVPAVSGIGVAVSLGFAVFLTTGPRRETFCLPGGCSYVVDDFTRVLQVLFLLTAVVVVLLSARLHVEDRVPAGEYHFLLLAAFTGMLTMAASRDLIMLVVSLEVVSLPTFALVGLRRYDARGGEAALKFFVISVLSTAVTLYGMSLIYGVTGSVQLPAIADALTHHRAELGPVAAVGVVLVVAGFGFKIAAVPFHFWAPDTYVGAPVPVAALLSVASKAAGFAGLIVLLVIGFAPYARVWGPVIAVVAALTMTLGNLVALRQRHAVRLLAWSSVAQSGYILLPLGVAASTHGRTVLGEAIAASLSYLVIYAAMNLGAFACVVAVGRSRPRNDLADYRGLARRSPFVAGCLAFFLACLAGLPPGLSGLFAKVVVFRAAVAGHAGWLVVVLAINVVIGLYYYLAWAATLFASPVEEKEAGLGVLPRSVTLAIGLTLVASIALSVAPQLVLHVTPLAALVGG
jgi:NADH-quinone oxidoreductase subunit N